MIHFNCNDKLLVLLTEHPNKEVLKEAYRIVSENWFDKKLAKNIAQKIKEKLDL